MGFQKEHLGQIPPVTFADEHRRAQLTHVSDPELLLTRWVDTQRQAVLYLSAEHRLMAHAHMSYAFYVEGIEIRLNASCDSIRIKSGKLEVSLVTLPARCEPRRDELEALMVDALSAHMATYATQGTIFPVTPEEAPVPKFHRATWQYEPERFTTGRLAKEVRRLTQRIEGPLRKARNRIASPLALLLGLLASSSAALAADETRPFAMTAAVLTGIWLVHRLKTYDPIWKPGPWLVGRFETETPWSLMARLYEHAFDAPDVYTGLQISLEAPVRHAGSITLGIVNNGPHTILGFRLDEKTVATFIAPGLLSMTLEDQYGKLGNRRVEEVVKAVHVQKIKPGRRVDVAVGLVPGFVPQPMELTAWFALEGTEGGRPRSFTVQIEMTETGAN